MKDYISRQDAMDVLTKTYRYESDRLTALQELPVVTGIKDSDKESMRVLISNAAEKVFDEVVDKFFREKEETTTNEQLRILLFNAIELLVEQKINAQENRKLLSIWEDVFEGLGTNLLDLMSLGLDLSESEYVPEEGFSEE